MTSPYTTRSASTLTVNKCTIQTYGPGGGVVIIFLTVLLQPPLSNEFLFRYLGTACHSPRVYAIRVVIPEGVVLVMKVRRTLQTNYMSYLNRNVKSKRFLLGVVLVFIYFKVDFYVWLLVGGL